MAAPPQLTPAGASPQPTTPSSVLSSTMAWWPMGEDILLAQLCSRRVGSLTIWTVAAVIFIGKVRPRYRPGRPGTPCSRRARGQALAVPGDPGPRPARPVGPRPALQNTSVPNGSAVLGYPPGPSPGGSTPIDARPP